MSAAAIRAERAIDRTRRISEALCDMEEAVATAVDAALSRLADEGAYRVHRDWSRGVEDRLIAKAAGKAAVLAVLASDWIDVPGEVQLIHGYIEAKLGGAA